MTELLLVPCPSTGIHFRSLLWLEPSQLPNMGFIQPMFQVRCNSCGVSGPWHTTKEEAIKAYNATFPVKP